MSETFVIPSAPPSRRLAAKLTDGMLWLTMCCGSVVFFEPSPYDLMILVTMALWAFGGFSIHRAVLPYVLALSLWVLGAFISLVPYWNETDPVAHVLTSFYLATTGVFFALYTSQDSTRRLDLLLSGYTISCVLAAAVAVATWLAAGGEESAWVLNGRATAPFKDPNVLGSYLVAGALYLTQRLLLGRLRYLWLTLPSLGLILAALFLTFSRGSWGAWMIATGLMVFCLYRTADSRRMRRMIVGGAAATALTVLVGVAGALSVDSVREFFFIRAAVQQDYDSGPYGRFGNQLRSLPMLTERPTGFGPMRFILSFPQAPHNSYINAFASDGWLGGFAFIAMAAGALAIGFRQCLTRHPWMRQAQILFPTTFVYFVQGIQIDIDHWRMFHMSLGAVWGIEAARRRWLARGDPEGAAP